MPFTNNSRALAPLAVLCREGTSAMSARAPDATPGHDPRQRLVHHLPSLRSKRFSLSLSVPTLTADEVRR